MKHKKKKTSAVFVLGMHRSGTSVFTRLISDLGVFIGENLIVENDDNPTGYYEDAFLLETNRTILKRYTSDPEYGIPDIHTTLKFKKNEIHALNNYFSLFPDKTGQWGVKDPRLCLTFPMWQNYLNKKRISCRAILTLRNPLEVARSLNKRGISEEYGLLLWFMFNFRALNSIKNTKTCFVKYNDLFLDPAKTISKVSKFIGKYPQKNTGQITDFKNNFLDENLYRNTVSKEETDRAAKNFPWIFDLYNFMSELAAKEEVNRSDIGKELSANRNFYILLEKALSKNREKTITAQIFWDTGDGFCEEQSSTNIINFNEDKIHFNIPANAEIKKLRFDPAGESCVIRLKNISISNDKGDVSTLAIENHNSFYQIDDLYFFSTDDPNLTFAVNSFVSKVSVTLTYLPPLTTAGKSGLKSLIAEKSELHKTIKQMNSESIKSQSAIQAAEAMTGQSLITAERAGQEARALRNEIEEMSSSLDKISFHLEHEKKTLEDSIAELSAKLKSTEKISETKLIKLNEFVAELSAKVESTEEISKNRLIKIEELNNVIRNLEQTVLDKEAQIQAGKNSLEKAHQEWQNSIDAFHNSLSWRMTAPLRCSYSLFKLILKTGYIHTACNSFFEKFIAPRLSSQKSRALLHSVRYSKLGTVIYSHLDDSLKYKINYYWAGASNQSNDSPAPSTSEPFRSAMCEPASAIDRKPDSSIKTPAPQEKTDGVDLISNRIIEKIDQPQFIICLSHDDYTMNVGGVQANILDEQKAFNDNSTHYIHYYPLRALNSLAPPNQRILVGINFDGVFIGTCSSSELPELGKRLKNISQTECRGIIVQHLLSWDIDGAEEFITSLNSQVLFWIHDYLSVCPQYNLLRNDYNYCGNPDIESNSCLICRYGEQRRVDLPRFKKFFRTITPTFLTPSEISKQIWLRSFEINPEKVVVTPLLSMNKSISSQKKKAQLQSRSKKINIAFIGHPNDKKGWKNWRDLVDKQADLSRHFKFIHLGNRNSPNKEDFYNVNVSEKDRFAMVAALKKKNIDIVLLWSTWPETYSYVMHEAISTGAFILTCKKSGNIARQVQKHNSGRVFDDHADMVAYLNDTNRVVNDLESFKETSELYDLEINIITPQLLPEIN